MVRRVSWEMRVEWADQRRREAKQRKQKTEDRKQYKIWAQELLRVFDTTAERLGMTEVVSDIHIWTDILAADDPPLLDLMIDEKMKELKHKQRRQRSHSLTENIDAIPHGTDSGGIPSPKAMALAGTGGRRRSNSLNEKPKKKVHPRSKDCFNTVEDDDGGLATYPHGNASTGTAGTNGLCLSLCRAHFFTGKCDENRKKGTCRCFHYSSHYKTLSQVMDVTRNITNRQEILAAETAAESCAETDDEREPGGVDMVYHVKVGINNTKSNDTPLSDQIVDALSQKNIKVGNIVYVVAGHTLVFDRYREGIVLANDADFVLALSRDSEVARRKTSIGSEGDSSDDEGFQFLPETVLEHILTFLPDNAVAISSQVCKQWYYEIGQNSPNLWLHLLERRKWPLPDLTVADSPKDCRTLYRDCFLRHFSVVRDVSAIQAGLGALDGTRRPNGSTEYAAHDFSVRSRAPTEDNHCVGVHVWAPNQVLAAYTHDCSLRLFQTLIKADSNEVMCKEMVRHRIDPYRKTKRRKCQLLSMGLDDDCIGCLCLVSSDSVQATAYILVVLSRDNFLLSDMSDNGDSSLDASLNVIDIGQAVLNYILSSTDDVELMSILFELVEYLQHGGELGAIEVLVSNNISSCGYSRFFLEVAISIPFVVNDDDGDEPTLRLLGRKLVLFSADVGAIVWVGESPAVNRNFIPRSESVHVSALRRGSRAHCTIGVTPQDSPGSISIIEIQSSGEVVEIQSLECPHSYRLTLEEHVWSPSQPFRAMQVTPSHIVSANTFQRPINGVGGNVSYKAIVTFCPRLGAMDDSSWPKIQLDNMEVLQLSCIRDDYIILLCLKHVSFSETAAEDANESTLLEGQRLLSPRTDDSILSQSGGLETWAVIIHVPTFSEIGRHLLLATSSHLHLGESAKLTLTQDSSGTIGVGFSWKGIVMTGGDTRRSGTNSIGITGDNSNRMVKKKKKRKGSKSTKKDGFVIGSRMW